MIARSRKAMTRRRWFAVASVMSLAVVTGSAATGQSASGAPPAGQPRPVVDAKFLYDELYFLGTQFIFRSAGADGPLSNPNDPNNLPQNYNGAQEFYKWFGDELTNTDNAHMG